MTIDTAAVLYLSINRILRLCYFVARKNASHLGHVKPHDDINDANQMHIQLLLTYGL